MFAILSAAKLNKRFDKKIDQILQKKKDIDNIH